MSDYGRTAVHGDAWIRARAQEILTKGLPDLPPPVGDEENEDHGEDRRDQDDAGGSDGEQDGDSGAGDPTGALGVRPA